MSVLADSFEQILQKGGDKDNTYKNLRVLNKGLRACCEACVAGGYLEPDTAFEKRMEGDVEIGFLSAITDK